MKETIKNLLKFSVYGAYSDGRTKKKTREKLNSQKTIISNYISNHKVKKLQIGCGANIYEGWLNTDLQSKESIAFLDAGNIFPMESETFDYIYSEHLFEHLTADQQINMLSEGARILKKGGIMRIATPSLDFLFNLYENPQTDMHSEYTEWTVNHSPYLQSVKEKVENKESHYCYVINNFFKAWGHQMIHNFKSLERLALQYGYKNVSSCKVGESTDEHLKNVERHGTVIPSKMNLLETMVVELIK
ncbi:class I SAM-dependent methyltransferase [Ulvibacter antarcticus]|uniref:Putative SAM-dependent methyltransferase n=1 Tax=Ulvibacter antarcticus TaxID=442714 RepID=A0A3L9YJ68_9FLAO|nr:methyltransferase domain-containing protein [Ulvibacter antarcticus]RMA57978.1 putative SAM-dependent methyltransferase [Ulvibacter antarcticus]